VLRVVARPGFPRSDALYDVDARSASEAWAVGSYEVSIGRTRTLVATWNGSAWAPVATPNANPDGYNSLGGVRAVPNASGMVWAVGTYSDPISSIDSRALILQRTGGAWRTTAAPRVTSSDSLEAVDAIGSADAWAVGWGSNGPYNSPDTPIALHWNGSGWRATAIPGKALTSLYGVEARSANDVWAVGQTYPGGPYWVPAVLHFNGSSWTRVPVPAPPGGGQLNDVVALSPTNVYAVGSAGDGTALVVHWNGSSWTRESTPSAAPGAQLTGAATVGSNVAWAAGYRVDPATYDERTLTIRTNTG
jgi:hypothetical protein